MLETVVKDNTPISVKLIKDIHSLVLMAQKQDAGVYRKILVYISGSSYQPVQPYLIESSMEKLIYKYNKLKKPKHIIEAIAIFHLLFESIHPFIDGNGRTGRLLINYELMKNHYLPIDIKYKDVNQYYNAFDIYHKSGTKDYSVMIELIAGYVLSRLKDFKMIINTKASNR